MLERLIRRNVFRRAFIVVACCVLVLQTFLAGLHAAEMGAAADQTSAAICHSDGGSAEKPLSGGGEGAVDLCPLCALMTPPLVPSPVASIAAPLAIAGLVYFAPVDAFAFILPPPRAGLARAPPQSA
jgi:hypothetical protein